MIIKAARELQMMVVPEGGSLFYMNKTHVLDGHTGVEHSLPVPRIYKDMVKLFARSKSGYTPTLIVGYGGLSGEYYWYQHTNVWENERLLASCRARSSTRGRGGGRWRRTTTSITSSIAQGAKQILDAGGRAARGARPAAGARRALGAVDAAAGRHVADGGAARARPSTARATSASTAIWVAREGQARRPRSCSTGTRSRTSGTPSR